MIKEIYQSIFEFSKKKPVKLWALSLLAVVLVELSFVMGGCVLIIGSSASILFTTAILMICYKAIRGEVYHIDNLFDYFKDYKQALRIIGGSLYAGLFVLLWSLIPIVGPIIAIVKIYEYRLVPFILVNEPDVRMQDARIVSSLRTKGFKKLMFFADVLWIAVCVLALCLLYSFCKIPYVGWIFYIAFVPALIAFVSLIPVVSNLLRAEFYSRIPSKCCTGKAKELSEDSTSVLEEIIADVFDPEIEVELTETPIEDIISSELASAQEAAEAGVAAVQEAVEEAIADLTETPVKKTPARKTAARKTTAKKAPAKKTAARKTAVKKAVEEKSEE